MASHPKVGQQTAATRLTHALCRLIDRYADDVTVGEVRAAFALIDRAMMMPICDGDKHSKPVHVPFSGEA